MNVEKIKSHEDRFAKTLVDSGGVKYTREIVTVGDLEIHKIRPDFENYYKPQETNKDLIVVHHSEGYLKGDIDVLVNDDSSLSVSYVISRSGIVYELFDPKYWAWHLGKGAIGGNQYNSKRSIAIELSNAGVLKEQGDILTDYNSKYCSKAQTEYYTELDEPFRGEKFFATFTDEQYEVLGKLIKYLCKEYKIPKKYLAKSKRYNTFESPTAAKEFKGVCSHINYRASGKWDLGPAFDWDRVIETAKVKTVQTVTEDPTVDDQEIVLDEVVVTTDTNEHATPKKSGSIIESVLNVVLALFKKRG